MHTGEASAAHAQRALGRLSAPKAFGSSTPAYPRQAPTYVRSIHLPDLRQEPHLIALCLDTGSMSAPRHGLQILP